MAKRCPSHAQEAPAEARAALTTAATPFMLVAPEKSRPVMSLETPPTETAKLPSLTEAHAEASASPSERMPPLRMAGVGVLPQRPTQSCAGRGDWEK